jgi:hypothetical protein
MNNNKKNKALNLLIAGVLCLSMFQDSKVISAEEMVVPAPTAESGITLDASTIERGYTYKFNESFAMAFQPKVLKKASTIEVKEFPAEQFVFPDGLTPVSAVYDYEFPSANLAAKKSVVIKFNFPEDVRHARAVYSYDFFKEKWQPLKSDNPNRQSARFSTALAKARLVILAQPEVLEFGTASWYAYKKCDCAASPDYPKGTKLLVRNLDNGKELIVKVNDYGPDRAIHPDRVIDLDKTAFKKLGKLSQGLLKNIQVTILDKNLK